METSCQLLAEPVVRNGEKIGITEEEWRDDDDAIADWEAWIGTIEPMVWAEGEREEYERYREEVRHIVGRPPPRRLTPDCVFPYVAVYFLKLALREFAGFIIREAWTLSNSRRMFARG
jgi:hypothetical protein